MKNQLQMTIGNYVNRCTAYGFKQIRYLLIPALFFVINSANAQESKLQIAKDFLNKNQTKYQLDKSSLDNLIVTDQTPVNTMELHTFTSARLTTELKSIMQMLISTLPKTEKY